jgi:hypothetical protein
MIVIYIHRRHLSESLVQAQEAENEQANEDEEESDDENCSNSSDRDGQTKKAVIDYSKPLPRNGYHVQLLSTGDDQALDSSCCRRILSAVCFRFNNAASLTRSRASLRRCSSAAFFPHEDVDTSSGAPSESLALSSE